VRLEKPSRVIVTEVKWRLLSAAEKTEIKESLKEKWSRSTLSGKYPSVEFEVLDAKALVPAP
jgi:hypothetical protein